MHLVDTPTYRLSQAPPNAWDHQTIQYIRNYRIYYTTV